MNKDNGSKFQGFLPSLNCQKLSPRVNIRKQKNSPLFLALRKQETNIFGGVVAIIKSLRKESKGTYIIHFKWTNAGLVKKDDWCLLPSISAYFLTLGPMKHPLTRRDSFMWGKKKVLTFPRILIPGQNEEH